MPRLAVLILTRNEEKNIAACIESAAFADEIVVVDSGSTDGTERIAREMGARFVVHPMDDAGFAGQRNFALTVATAEWVLYLDADERLTAELAAEVRATVEAGEEKIYLIQRENVVFGQLMHYGTHRPDWVPRLYPRTAIHWTGRVHEGIETSLPEARLRAPMRHYTYTTWRQYLEKFNRYTTLAAESVAPTPKKVTRAGALGHAVFAFISDYILHQGFRDGFLGLVMSIMAANYRLMKYLKVINIRRTTNAKYN